MVARAQHNGRVTRPVTSKEVVISRETAQLLLNILGQTTLAVGSPDFEVMASGLVKAKGELVQALGDGVPPPSEE